MGDRIPQGRKVFRQGVPSEGVLAKRPPQPGKLPHIQTVAHKSVTLVEYAAMSPTGDSPPVDVCDTSALLRTVTLT